MGSGIAQKMATEGFDVVLVDVDDERVARGIGIIERTLKEAVDRGIMRLEKTAAIRERVHGTALFDGLRGADLVVEAVFEDLALKQDVFKRLEAVCRPDAILATNTSSYLVSDVASAVATPERVLGLHYFFHPAKNRLVEVIRGSSTDRQVFDRAWMLQEQLGKIPIESHDASGFVVNRFFVVWLMEAIRLLEEGVASAMAIDDIAKRTFGVGMGPFELMNVSGVPIALHASTSIGRAHGALYGPPDLLKKQVASGKPWPLAGMADTSAEQTVADRLLAGVFLAATALVDEGVGTKEDVDIGARVGLRWRAGPFEMMNARGAAHHIRLVKTEATNAVTTITINRPDTMNALNEAVAGQLSDAFRSAAQDAATSGIVITGAGSKSFVAGADIRFFIRNIETHDIARTAAFTGGLQALFLEIQHCTKAVVARLHGLALGGGVELALACDYIVATPNAALGFPETGIGIFPGLGGTQRTTRRIGAGLTKWLVLTGQILTAQEALAIGLIDAVASRDELEAAVLKMLARGPAGERRPAAPPEAYRKLAVFFDSNDVDTIRQGRANTGGDEQLDKAMKTVGTKAPIALKIAAALVDEGSRVPLEEGLRMELSHVSEVFATRDALTGLRSIGGERPRFEGA
jgi:enoyl-CoA hydratase / 3-hydroxyacyl-CoA dehydrogenase